MHAQFSDQVNIEPGARSLRTYERFDEQFDQEIDLHQVGYLPAVGEVVRDLCLGRTPCVDVTGLSADRFIRGVARPERTVV